MTDTTRWIEGKWRDITLLPAHAGGRWCVHENGEERHQLEDGVTLEVARSLPPRPLLVGHPDAETLLPPVMVEGLRDLALGTVRRNTRNITIGLTGGAIALLVIAKMTEHQVALAMGLTLLALASIQLIDLRLALGNAEGVAQRSLFFYWMKRDARESPLGRHLWLAVAGMIGAFQLSMHFAHGGMTGAFHAVGVMYGEVASGEWWRLLTGPFLHYSLTHYGLNAALLVIFAPFARLFLGASSLALFLAGSAASAAGQMVLGGALYDNFGGVSGGIYALLGATLAIGLTSKAALPKGLLLLLLNLGIVGIASAELTSPNAATAAHLTGLLFGMAWAGISLKLVTLQAHGGFGNTPMGSTQTKDLPRQEACIKEDA